MNCSILLYISTYNLIFINLLIFFIYQRLNEINLSKFTILKFVSEFEKICLDDCISTRAYLENFLNLTFFMIFL